MARPWAKAFYRSKAWKACRRAYAESKHWLCEKCGEPGKIVHHSKVYLTPENINDPNITMGWWNLELDCQDCHNKEHHTAIGPTRDGFAFDAEGNLVRSE